jgi:DNA-binding NtrC family response regulator
MPQRTVVVIATSEAFHVQVRALALRQGYEVIIFSDPTTLFGVLRQRRVGLVILWASSSHAEEQLEVVQQIRRWDSQIPIFLTVEHSSEELAIAAFRAGVTDYFHLPTASEDLKAKVTAFRAGAARQSGLPTQDAAASGRLHAPGMVGETSRLREIKAYLAKVAESDSSVLITGETGTGKEVVACSIHSSSPRRQKPLVCINCAAIPDSLLESELFGYERGAFTGAHTRNEGKLKLADGGTVFFDEIGDMSPYAQAKILRAIESKEVYRLGGKASIPVDVRIIAATNRDLAHLMAEDKFRADLYFRLNVVSVHLPPLRDRREDIPVLLAHYLCEFSRRCKQTVVGFTDDALATLRRYDWPGNIRELKNVVEALAVSGHAGWISTEDLPEQFRRRCGEAEELPQDERERVLRALLATDWNRSEAAQRLHWSRMTLYRKMVKYQIEAKSSTEEVQRSA